MKIMSINAGSSSLKFSLFEMNDNSLIASGYFERVGLNDSFYTIKRAIQNCCTGKRQTAYGFKWKYKY